MIKQIKHMHEKLGCLYPVWYISKVSIKLMFMFLMQLSAVHMIDVEFLWVGIILLVTTEHTFRYLICASDLPQ